tara:strand:+ start:247 stop:876 length:630 start_codon:yes stop_codon:yes gene_type:complete
MKKKSGIYKLTINNKCYVGFTKDFDKRKREHHSTIKRNKHINTHLQNAYNKYKEFDFSIIEESKDIKRECYWIEKLDTFYNGYNRSLGADGGAGHTKTPEQIKKQADKVRGEKNYQWRGDITREKILEMKEKGLTKKEICSILNTGAGTLWRKFPDITFPHPFSRPCIIDGISYNGIKEAARMIGVKRMTISYRLKSKYFPQWVFNDEA